jgi:ubiquinone/menaquinone biosynthesis C-methylase UbiE
MSEVLRARVREQFGRAPQEYTLSVSHSDASMLERMCTLLELNARQRVLDVATGSGHTAMATARYVSHVTALDVTMEMLREMRANAGAKNLSNISTVLGDALALPFSSASFDVVTCRIAPHHFADLNVALREAARVLQPGGMFYVLDCSAPDDPDALSFIDEIEKLRDPSHVATYPPSHWQSALTAADFTVKKINLLPRRYDLFSWLDRARSSERARHLIFRKIARRNSHLAEIFPAILDGPAPFLQSYFVEIVAMRE